MTDTHPPAEPPRETPILAADQATRRVVLLDTAPGAPAAVRWTWTADGDPAWAGYTAAHAVPQERHRKAWNNVSEAKARTWRGRPVVLTTASGGLAAVVEYPSGTVRWIADTGSNNLHSIELLPDGGVVVAASSQGLVRLHPAALTGAGGGLAPVDVKLPGAHGVHWDAARGLLWALGTHDLAAYRPAGDGRGLRQERSVPLPGSGGGHDLAPVHADPDRLWIAAMHRVTQYSISRGAFVPYPAEAAVSRSYVKAVGDEPGTGRVLSVAEDDAEANPISWATERLDLASADGARTERRTVPGASFYKARWFTPAPPAA